MTRRLCAFEAIGTKWSVVVQSPLSQAAWTDVQAKLRECIEAFDKTYSRFRPDSLVTQMSQYAGTYNLPHDGYNLLHFYEKLYRVTDGLVTPLIGQVLSDAGYDAVYSFRTQSLKQPPNWANVIEYNPRYVMLKQPALLDFGAAGKGYLVDLVAKLLDEAKLTDFTINAGGDILHRSAANQLLRVGLEHPKEPEKVIGVVTVSNQSLCASAGSRRQWGNYHHLLNPITLESPKNILATWAIADDTMTADGLATALFFATPAKLSKHFQFAYAILRADMSLEHSKSFPVDTFTDA